MVINTGTVLIISRALGKNWMMMATNTIQAMTLTGIATFPKRTLYSLASKWPKDLKIFSGLNIRSHGILTPSAVTTKKATRVMEKKSSRLLSIISPPVDKMWNSTLETLQSQGFCIIKLYYKKTKKSIHILKNVANRQKYIKNVNLKIKKI